MPVLKPLPTHSEPPLLVAMSVRAAPLNTAAADLGTAISEVQPEAAALAEGNSFTTQSSETPLTRNIVVSIRASLNDVRARRP